MEYILEELLVKTKPTDNILIVFLIHSTHVVGPIQRGSSMLFSKDGIVAEIPTGIYSHGLYNTYTYIYPYSLVYYRYTSIPIGMYSQWR